ncbi:MAG TPA: glycosyltransferase family 2 protein [Lacunisphaera sp.]|nr:glycosyltransferase family 2 protein [Lacunisphaera sp.]
MAAPAYNEAENLGPLVEAWHGYLAARFPAGCFEIVICNDGSKDDTARVLDALAGRFSAVRPCHHAVNQGAAAALATAIRHTTQAWVLLLDADGQFPIENLERFAAAHERDPAPAYIGFRPRKEDSPFARFGSWASGWACNLFHGTRYRDFNCALKCVEGRLLRDLSLEAKGLNYSTEISSKILERGVAMREVAVLHQPRRRGRSSRSLIRGSLHRLLLVAYLGFRQLLFRLQVLQRRPYTP